MIATIIATIATIAALAAIFAALFTLAAVRTLHRDAVLHADRAAAAADRAGEFAEQAELMTAAAIENAYLARIAAIQATAATGLMRINGRPRP